MRLLANVRWLGACAVRYSSGPTFRARSVGPGLGGARVSVTAVASRSTCSLGLIVAAMLCACGAGPHGAAPHAAPRAEAQRPMPAPSAFAAVYREAANAFEILDNASAWFPEKNEAEYRD